MAVTEVTTPFFMSEEVQALAKSTADELLRSGNAESMPPAVKEFVTVLSAMAKGEAVSVFPVQAELTVHEAAEVLGASESFVTDLLDSGVVAFRQDGSRKMITLNDLLAYEKDRKRLRKEAIGEMIRESQSLGLY